MVYDYAEIFGGLLAQKYEKELCSDALTKSNPQVRFLNAQTIKLPRMAVSGYKDHTRTPGFNSGTLSNEWEPKKLEHDRDIEFFVDPMDIDETNLTLSVANIQNTFETEQAIPEKDCYRFSKLHAELETYSGRIDKTVVDAAVFLDWFDSEMAYMDEAGVPVEGRILYVTPTMNKVVKHAEGLQRTISVTTANSINRNVHNLDDVDIKMVPAARMKTQ
ncbi:MAG: capsid protein, partial [Lachnospiraceae bacterium]|nr:capsid protein [Lachnospiraceae bacterium]